MSKSIYTLVGWKQIAGAEALVASLPRGESLVLQRDYGNRFDDNAVKVSARGRQVGFVKATEVVSLAAFMDRAGTVTLPGTLAIDGHRWPMIEVETP